MNIDQAKNIIDSQFKKAIHADSILNNFHPMRVIQALKSLIGIDIDNPSQRLVEWGDGYLEDLKILPNQYFKYYINKPKETIVLSDLGRYILLSDEESSVKELQDLCSVSDGNQIFEYLIEFSCINNMKANPFIWSAFRSNAFLNNKFNTRKCSCSNS